MPKYVLREDVDTSAFFDALDIHPLTLLLLYHRGITDKEEAEKFLLPSYERDIGNPMDIFGMKQAVLRIIKAIKEGEKIAVYSDYDCDGIPGGVLLREFFQSIGYPVEIYIPHRHNEGYGLHNHAIDKLKDGGVSLIITVDSGITNIDEVAYAKKKGVDLIVTDHHLPITKELKNGKVKQVVPDACAVINSKQDVCTYEDDMLCGCAVAWKLTCALLATLRKEKKGKYVNLNAVLHHVEKLPSGFEKWLLDLVGISTISDMVPLVKENRALAHFGLKVLQKTKRPGLNHIFYTGRIEKDKLTEDDIAFTIAPRINAASRMGEPIQAHHMLFEKNPDTAIAHAIALEQLNTERKQGVKDVVGTISFDHEAYKEDVVVVGDPSWGPGILGLIAQKIIDETGKPVFVWGQGDDKEHAKGSCRSKGEVSVVDLMAHAGKKEEGGVFTHFGGHEQAGGFSLLFSDIEKLAPALNNAIKHVVCFGKNEEETFIDAELRLDDVHEVTHNAVQALAPFGAGNSKPLFSFVSVTPVSVRWFGKQNEHIEVVYQKEKGQIKAIHFFADKELEEKLKKAHTLLAHLEKSYWGGKGELRLRVVDVI
ncbi:MAG: single-stranded-DNA-specific exonuclease [Patescibacteria group bacterium]|nr:single-stranded-DNA-specific exonuclease [Patescibacteria group bacterium]